MAQPTPFNRQTSFAQYSANYPNKPQNGGSLDGEFNAVKVAMDETQANLARIQDDDGRLARGSVGRAQLDSSILLGFESPEPWAAGIVYTEGLSTVWYQGKFYSCAETHSSTDTFEADKWFEIADLSVSASIEDGSITDVKLADDAVTSQKIAPLAVTTSKIASGAVTLAKLAAALPAQLADLIIPVGFGPVPYSLPGPAPSGWAFPIGQEITADAAPAYHAALVAAGNPHGTANGNPKALDMRGRMAVCRDNLGGVAAGLVTTAGSGVDGTTVGAKGGAQARAISLAQLPIVNLAEMFNGGAQWIHSHIFKRRPNTVTVNNGTQVDVHAGSLTDDNTSSEPMPSLPTFGSGQSTPMMPPVAVVSCLIKVH